MLTVKGGSGVTCDHGHDEHPSPAGTLTGTPVVPGIAHGPVLLARTEVSPAAIDAFDGSALSEDAALARFDEVAAAVSEGFAAKAQRASGAAAEVLTASAGLARDKGLRSAVLKQLKSGDDLLTALQAAVESFVAVFTGMGGLMAERVTDLRDIERRMVARVVGEPEPGVPVPEEPCVLVAADLAPADTAGLDPERVLALVTERGGPTSHTAIIARQLGIPCVVGTSGALDVPSGSRLLVDGTTGVVEIDPDEAEAERRVATDVEERAALESWAGPGLTADGKPIRLLANVADGESARSAVDGAPVEGVGLFRTELASSTQGRADRRGAGRDLWRGAGRLPRHRAGGPRPLRRGADPGRRLGQAAGLRQHDRRGEPRARRARAAAVLRQPGPDGAAAGRHRRPRPRTSAPRPG